MSSAFVAVDAGVHAIRQYAFGPAENLRYEEVPDPRPSEGQVRIAVEAAGVHLIDTLIRAGEGLGPYPPPELPMTPGREVAGVVDRVGSGVEPDWLGRRVVTHLGLASSGYAELAVRELDAVHVLPDGLSYEAAVALIGTGRTTMAILDLARLVPDDVVLVTAAAGGIGNLLVQTARNLGATVVGVAGGPEKVERVRELGATAAVDYAAPDWTDAVCDALDGQAVTVGFDGVGGVLGRAAYDLLGPGGRLISFGWSSGGPIDCTADEARARQVTVTQAVGPGATPWPASQRELEERALAEAGSGRWTPAVQTFPLAEAAAAHAALESRGTMGKVVLRP